MDWTASELKTSRDERMANCMKHFVVSSLPSGGRKITRWRCKDSRCEYCNEHKGLEYKQRILDLIKDGTQIYMVSMPSSIVSSLCKGLHRENYLRLPGEENDIVFIKREDVEAEFTEYEFDEEDCNEFDWTTHVARTGKRIISGNLGKQEKKRYPIEYDAVCFIVDTTEELLIKSINQATYNIIAWQQPEDFSEYQRYHNIISSEIAKQFIINEIEIVQSFRYKDYTSDLKMNFFERVVYI